MQKRYVSSRMGQYEKEYTGVFNMTNERRSGLSVPDLTLWHGDCLELMKNIPDNSVDMVLTDPP